MARQCTVEVLSAHPVALDFLNSGARGQDLGDDDALGTGEGLLTWLGDAGLVPATVLNLARTDFATAELDQATAEARSLREWFRAFVDAHKGQRVGETELRELGRLNALLERDDSYTQLVQAGSQGTGFGLQVRRRWQSPELLLVAIAQTLAAFVCEADFSHVKVCEGPGCRSIFADETREQKLRWCRGCPGSPR